MASVTHYSNIRQLVALCKHYLCDVDIVFVSCMVHAPFCVLLLLNEFVILESFFLLADDISGVFLTK